MNHEGIRNHVINAYKRANAKQHDMMYETENIEDDTMYDVVYYAMSMSMRKTTMRIRCESGWTYEYESANQLDENDQITLNLMYEALWNEGNESDANTWIITTDLRFKSHHVGLQI